ncbi:hypothetical protein AGMMS49546_30010 [Spirochaetia bacterium]|nr:hypothetical protein AGMMS49546_30010 [Spirochaetia bacterium]
MINKRITMILGLIALAALPLAAQDIQAPPSIGAPKSTTKNATADRIGTDVDNFLDYTGHTGVKFDNWFGYAGYEGLASVGYARKLGSIYLGAWYKGNVARTQAAPYTVGLPISFDPTSNGSIGSGNSIYLVDLINPNYDAFGKLTSTAVENTEQQNPNGTANTNVIQSDNQLQALIGFGNMAVKVGFREFLFSQPDSATDGRTTTNPSTGLVSYTSAVESFSDLHGNLQPNVGWGAAFALGKFTLKPKAEVAIAIVQDAREEVTKSGSTTYGNGTVTSTKTGYVNNFVRPSITVGADFALEGKNGGTWTPGIAYNIYFDVYSNDYDAYGSSGTVKGLVDYGPSGTIHVVAVSPTSTVVTDTANITVTEKSGVYHVVQPAISYSDNFGDRVKFGFKAQVPVYFGSKTESSYGETTVKADTKYTNGNSSYSTSVTKNNQAETVTSQFRISPKIDVGTSYQVIPGKLALNAGVSGTFGYRSTEARQTPNGYQVQTTYTTNQDGNVTANTKTVTSVNGANDTLTKVYAWDAFTPTFGAGLTINFTETFALDTSFQTGTNVNLGMVQLLLSLKK